MLRILRDKQLENECATYKTTRNLKNKVYFLSLVFLRPSQVVL